MEATRAADAAGVEEAAAPLTKGARRSLVDEPGPKVARGKRDPAELTERQSALKKKFDEYDNGRSGFIDRAEFKGLLEKFGVELTEAEFPSWAMGEGTFEFFQFADWFTSEGYELPVDSSSERVSAAFHYFDRDADGRLTPAEFREALQAAGLAPSQKEFEGLLVESGSSISYVSFKKAVDLLVKPEKALTKKRFIDKFKDLHLGTDKIPMALLEYICHNCQPTAGEGHEGHPVDQLTTEEVEYVLSLINTDGDQLDVKNFADELMPPPPE